MSTGKMCLNSLNPMELSDTADVDGDDGGDVDGDADGDDGDYGGDDGGGDDIETADLRL